MAYLWPRLPFMRLYFSARYMPLVLAAACAASVSAVRSHRERLRVFPEKCLPADSLLPGQSPAHEAKRCSDPKRSISAPILALQPYDGCPRDRVEKGPS